MCFVNFCIYFIFFNAFFNFINAKQENLLITIKDVVDKTKEDQEVSLTFIDFLSASDIKEVNLRKLGIEVTDDPTMGKKAEGDIAMPNFKKFMRDENGLGRNSVHQPYRKWINNVIPYLLSSQYGSYSRSIIAKAMNEYHTKTCVRFVARDPKKHHDYVYIHPDDGCYSLVGRVGGRQPLSLDSGCIQVGTIVHELMHAVGFFHEQSRYDRDQYIDISWQNVISGADDQFEKYDVNAIDQLNEPYDYGSIMHYGPYAFSSNGRQTIIARRQGSQKMGQRIVFSDIDLRKINKLYQCVTHLASNKVTTAIKPTTTSTSNQLVGINNSIAQVVEQPLQSSFPESSNSDLIEKCNDQNWRCSFWSIPEIGYCNLYAEIRLKVCRQSCGICKKNLNINQLIKNPNPKFLLTKKINENINEEYIENNECIDHSVICSEISIINNACSMPLTQSICRRTCHTCISDNNSQQTNDLIDEHYQTNRVLTADNIETPSTEIFESKPNLFSTFKNAKRLIGKTHITISDNSGSIISGINVFSDAKKNIDDKQITTNRRFSRTTKSDRLTHFNKFFRLDESIINKNNNNN